MIRLDSTVSLMVANEEQAKAVEAALKRGPLALMTSDDVVPGGESVLVVVLRAAESEADCNKALRILG